MLQKNPHNKSNKHHYVQREITKEYVYYYFIIHMSKQDVNFRPYETSLLFRPYRI